MPTITAGFRGTFDEQHVNQYRELTGLQAAEPSVVPMLYAHSFLGPLHLQMLTDSAVPVSVLGSVHSRNHILQYQPLRTSDELDVQLCLRPGRRRKQGYELDLTTDIRVDETLIWTSVSAFLVKMKKPKSDAELDLESVLASSIANIAGERHTMGTFAVPPSTGKRFGLLTRDVNPIHTSYLAAKAFGFERDLAHGMWGMARALPLLDATLDMSAPVRLDCAFKGPLYMERDVSVHAADKAAPGAAFEMYSGANPRPSIVGRVANVEVHERRPLSELGAGAPPGTSKL